MLRSDLETEVAGGEPVRLDTEKRLEFLRMRPPTSRTGCAS